MLLRAMLGTPLPADPLIEGTCSSFQVFGNGTWVYQTVVRLIDHKARPDVCEATIRLAGFRSTRVALHDGAVVMLNRLGEHEGSTISFTVLGAPARQHLKQAVVVYPGYATAWCELGEVLQRRGELAQARSALEWAIQADPKYIRPYERMAALALGVASARRAIDLDPEHVYAHAEYLLSAALAAQGELRGAVEGPAETAPGRLGTGGALRLARKMYHIRLTPFP